MSDYKQLRQSALNRSLSDLPRNVVPTGNAYQDYAVSRGISVDQARADHLNEVALRKKAELEGIKAKQQQERQLRVLAGESPDKVNREVAIAEQNASTMSGAQRLQNVMNGGYDPEFSRDLDNKSPEELGMLYGAEVQAFATQRARNELSAMATTMSNRGEQGSALGSIVQGATQGTANLLNTANILIHQGISAPIEALYDSATTDETYEAALRRKRAQGWKGHNEIQDGIDGFFSQFDSEAQANEKKSDMAVGQLAEALRLRNERQYRNKTEIDWDTARKAAASDADKLDNYGKNISKEKLFTGVGEQLPQLALAYATGGLGSSAFKSAGTAYAGRGALSFGEKAVVRLGTSELNKLGSIGASIGIGAEAGAQDFVGAGADAYKAVEELPQEALDKSPNYQKLIKSGMSPKDAREALAVEAADKAGTKSGLITAGSAGALGSIFEKALFGLGGKLTKNNAILGLGSPATEAFSEGLEEYWNNTAPKEAVNDVLGYNYHADPSIYSTSAVTQAAAISGLVGSAGAVRTSGSVAKQAASKALNIAKNTKFGKIVADKFNKASKDREETASAEATTFEHFHKSEDNENSATAAVIKTLVSEFAKAANVKEEDLTTKDYENFSYAVRDSYEKAKAENNTEKVKHYEAIFDTVRNAAFADLKENYSDKNILGGKRLSNMIKKLSDPNISEEQKAKYLEYLEQAKAKHIDSVRVAQVLESGFMANLDASRKFNPDQEADNVDISEYLNGKPVNLSNVLFSATKVKKDIQANPEKASAIFNKWVETALGTVTQEDVTPEILKNIKATALDMLGVVSKSDLSDNPYSTASIKVIKKLLNNLPDNTSETQAKTFYGKWLDPNKGVLHYITNMAHNDDGMSRLFAFRASQSAKFNALSNLLIEQAGNTDSKGNFKSPQKVLLEEDKFLQKQDGSGDVEFTSISQVQKYMGMLIGEEKAFDKIIQDVVDTLDSKSDKKPKTEEKAKTESKAKENTTADMFEEGETNNESTEETKAEPKAEEKAEPEKKDSTEEKVKSEPKEESKKDDFEEIKGESEPIIAEDKTEAKKEDKNTSESRQNEQEAKSEEKAKETPKTEEKAPKTESKPKTEEKTVDPTKGIYRNKKGEVEIQASKNRSSILSNFSKYSFEYGGLKFDSIEEAYQVFKSNPQTEEELQQRYEELTAKVAKLSGYRVDGNGIEVLKGKPKLSGTDTATNIELMRSLIAKRFKEDAAFREALLSTKDSTLVHGKGSVIEKAFTDILTELRDGSVKAATESKAKKDSINIADLDAEKIKAIYSNYGVEIADVNIVGNEAVNNVFKGVIYSGGAKGADRAWAAMINTTGVSSKQIHHFNLNDKDSMENAIGTNIGLKPDSALVNTLEKVISNFKDKDKFTRKAQGHIDKLRIALQGGAKKANVRQVSLTGRNILQVVWSSSVVAAAPATGNIRSGTMTAILLGAYLGKPVLVLDTNSKNGNDWYQVTGYKQGAYTMTKVADPMQFFGSSFSDGVSRNFTFVGSRNHLMNHENLRKEMVNFVTKAFNGNEDAIDKAFEKSIIDDGLMNDSRNSDKTYEETINDNSEIARVDSVKPSERKNFRQETLDAFHEAIADLPKEEREAAERAAVINGFYYQGDSVFARYGNKAMNQYDSLAKVLDSTEEITDEDKAAALRDINTGLSEEDATNMVATKPKEVDSLIDAVRNTVRFVEEKYAVSSLNLSKESMRNPSAVLDLYGKTEDGRVVMPKGFIIGLALGFIDAINHGLSGMAETTDNYEENVSVNNKSTYHQKFNPYFLTREDTNENSPTKGTLLVSKDAFKDIELLSSDLPSLGLPTNSYVEQLGNFMMKRLGVSFSKDMPIDVKHGTKSSLGNELFSLLHTSYLVRNYELSVPDGKFMTTKVMFSGALPAGISPHFARALQQIVFSAQFPNSEHVIYDPSKHGKVTKKGGVKETRTAEQTVEHYENLNFGEENPSPIANVIEIAGLTNNSLFEPVMNPEWEKEKGYHVARLGEESPFKGKHNPDVRHVPKTMKEARYNQTQIPFKLNLDAYALLKDNPELFFRLYGGKDLEDKEGKTTQKVEQITSKSDQLRQQILTVEKIIQEAIEKNIPLEELVLYFDNKVIANQRLMQTSPFNPQNNKILRELFQPVHNPISVEELEAMSKDGQVELTDGITLPLDVLKGYLADWEKGVTLTDDRDIVKHIKDVAKVLRDDLHNTTVTPVEAQERNLRNLFGAMAQSLGIKVEREAPHAALYKLAKLINTPLIQDAIAIQTAALKGDTKSLDYDKAARAFADKYGNDTARAFAAVRAIATYLTAPNGKFDSYLFFETDGVTNGTTNYTAQDGTLTDLTHSVGIFEGQYLQHRILKLQEQGVDINSLTPEELSTLIGGMPEALREREYIVESFLSVTPEEFDAMIKEGSIDAEVGRVAFRNNTNTAIQQLTSEVNFGAYEDKQRMPSASTVIDLFNNNGRKIGKAVVAIKSVVSDVYQQIAQEITNDFINDFGADLRFNDPETQDHLDTVHEIIKSQGLPQGINTKLADIHNLAALAVAIDVPQSDQYNRTARKIINRLEWAMYTFPQLAVRQPNARMYFKRGNGDVVSYVPVDFFGMTINDLISLSKKNVEVDAVSRSIAKSPSQPLVYGGGKNGIMNQMYNDWSSAIVNLVDRVRELHSDESTIKSDEATNLTRLLLTLQPTTGKFDFDVNKFKDSYYMSQLTKTIIRDGYDNVRDNLGKLTVAASRGVYSPLINTRQVMSTQSDSLLRIAYVNFHKGLEQFKKERAERNGWDENHIEYNTLPDKATFEAILKKAYLEAGLPTAASDKAAKGISSYYENNLTGNEQNLKTDSGLVRPSVVTNVASKSTKYGGDYITTYKIYEAFKAYHSLGAKVLTNTVVSREALVQDKVLQAFRTLGIFFTNVYDGLDAMWQYAKAFSRITNTAFYNVHDNSNITQDHLLKFMYSSIMNYRLPAVKEDKLKRMRELMDKEVKGVIYNNIVDANRALADAIDKTINDAEVKKPISVSGNEYLGYVTLTRSENNSENGFFAENKVKAFAEGKDVPLTELNTKQLMEAHLFAGYSVYEIEESGKFYISESIEYDNPNLVAYRHKNRLKGTFSDMRRQAIEKEVMYKVWNNDLPIAVGTFAGTGTGSTHNFNPTTIRNLEKLNQEYKQYVIELQKKDPDSYIPTFNEFVYSGYHSLGDKIKEYLRIAQGKYPVFSDIDKSDFATEPKNLKEAFKTLDKYVNSHFLSNYHAKLLYTLRPLMETLGIDELPVTDDASVFKEWADKAGVPFDDSGLVVEGQYIGGAGIYFDGQIKSLAHEVIHAVMENSLNLYFGTDKASIDFRKANKGFVQNAQLLVEQVKSFAKFLDDSSFLNDEVAKVMNMSANEIAVEEDKRVAIIGLAKVLDNPESTPKDKYVALQEILAYALTEESLVGKLAKASGAEVRGAKKSVWQKIVSAVRDRISVLTKAFSKLWFGSDTVAAKDSLMPELLASMQSLAEQAHKAEAQTEIFTNLYSATKEEAAAENEVYSFLDDLVKTYNNNSSIDFNSPIFSKPTNKVIFSLSDEMAKQLIANGYKLSPLQRESLSRLSLLLQTVMDNDNGFRTLATSILNDVMTSEDVENILPSQVVKVLQDKSSEGAVAQTLALLAVIPETSSLTNKAEEKVDILPRIGRTIENILSGNTKAKESLMAQIRHLASTASGYDYSLISDKLFKDEIVKEKFKDAAERDVIADKVENLTGVLPEGFASIIQHVMMDWASMPLEGMTNADTESFVGKSLQNILENRIKDKGRIDGIGRLIRLFIQMRNDTKPFYRMRASFSATLEHVRERSRKAVPNTIHAAFRQEGVKIRSGQDKAIANAILRTSAFNLYTGNSKAFAKLLTDSTARSARIESLYNELKNKLGSMGIDVNVANWINWQTSGLADLQTKRVAKSFNGITHSILPNTRAIAALPIGKQYTGNRTYQSLIDDLLPMVQEMTALKALNNVSNEDIAEVVELTKYKAFDMLMSQAKDIDNFGDKYDLRGTEGIVMNKRNPNQDMKVVKEGSEEMLEMSKMGYKPIDTIKWANQEYIVMFTDANPLSRYQAGSFGFAGMSNKGTALSSGEGLRSVATQINDKNIRFDQIINNTYAAAMYNKNFYDGMTEYSHVKPLIGRTGKIYAHSLEVDSDTVENTFQTTEEGISALGNLQGRYFEQDFTIKVNTKNAEILKNEYLNSRRKQEWIILDGKVKPLSNKPADIQYANHLNDFYERLPKQTRDLLTETKGLPVRKSEVDNIVGYNRIDVTNLFNGTSTLPTNVQETIRNVLGTFGISKENIKYLKDAQDVFAGLVGYVKEIMLIRSIIVPVQNIVSNVIHLVNLGIPLKDIVTNTRVGIAEAKRYTENRIQIAELYTAMRDPNMTQAKRDVLTARIKHLSDTIKNSPINPLVEAGMFSNISSAAGYEQQGLDKSFNIRSRVKDKLGLTDWFDAFNASGFGRFVNNLLIAESSDTFDFMKKSLDYGDFVAKFVLYEHLTKKSAINSRAALDIALEEFVNYSMNRGATFDYLNTMGLTWFVSYATGIQKVIWKMMRRSALKTSAIYAMSKATGISAVPVGNPIDKSWDYATSPTNVLDGFEAHYLHKLFEMF